MTHDTDPEQTVRAQLNKIADHWATHEEYPKGISVTDVQDLGQTLHEQLADRIDTYVAETNFTRREAEVWALHRNVDEHHHFVTSEAAALLFCTPDTGFGCTTDVNKTYPKRQTLTSEDVDLRFKAAKRTIDDAKQTLGAVTFPDRDDILTSPELVWLDRQTVQRLRQQRQLSENTLDDVATRVLDETETRYSLEAFVRGYLNARGTDNVVQVAVARESFGRETIRIATHARPRRTAGHRHRNRRHHLPRSPVRPPLPRRSIQTDGSRSHHAIRVRHHQRDGRSPARRRTRCS